MVLVEVNLKILFFAQTLPSRIAKKCFVFYIDCDSLPIIYQNPVIYIHTDSAYESLSSYDAIICKLVHIKKSGRKTHVTLRHIEHIDKEPYLRIARTEEGRFTLMPTEHCPKEFWSAFKVSLGLTGLENLVVLEGFP